MNPTPADTLDESRLRELVDAFYADVRRDPALGPLFERVVDGRWPAHLARIHAFWCGVALQTHGFRGNLMRTHLAIDGLNEALFGRWLALWQQHTEALLRPGDALKLQQIARGIARNLLLGLRARPAGLQGQLPIT